MLIRNIIPALFAAASAACWAHGEEKLGKVSFANTCAPAVQEDLTRAVALLHSFAFRDAEASFQKAWTTDTQCAISGWGIASALIGNTFAIGPNPQQAQTAKDAITRARSISIACLRETTPSKRSSFAQVDPARSRCMWLSISPGITALPFRSIRRVLGPAS